MADEDDTFEQSDVGEISDAHLVTNALPPSGLKEISSLASWTVSSSKTGAGAAALRAPDNTQFWQSDGPQPHYLTIHFFKLVSIVHMRIYLDFDNDESYTPTKIQFWAGMGLHDLQEFSEMAFEQPRGWIDVDFSRVGPIDNSATDLSGGIDWSTRPVLRAFLVQVRIIENHQNGKDTHLRGLQVFSVDPTATQQPLRPASSPSKPARTQHSKRPQAVPIRKAAWMLEPELR